MTRVTVAIDCMAMVKSSNICNWIQGGHIGVYCVF